jgi:ribosomal protein S18 acetylase RimI-like enzyme
MITIRKAKPEDAELMKTLWAEFSKLHENIVKTKSPFQRKHLKLKENAPQLFFDFIKKEVRSPKTAVFIAEFDGEPAGYCLCKIKNNLFYLQERFYGTIEDLYVRERFQGKGIASALKKAASEWFKKKGVEFVYLTVFPGNEKAISIYRKWGFDCWDIGMYCRFD